ncbi:MAG: hypothetical protein E7020_02580 [Alphaproteobacteria bacterium]|nr:hypothetical protein [Alphaproteobacteria bacterium]
MLRLLKVFVVVLIALGLDFSSAFAAVTPLNEYSGVSLMSTRSAAADGGTRAEQTPCSTDDWPHSVDATSLESTASDTSYLTQETYCNGEYEFQFSACAGNSVLPYTTAYTDDRSDWDNNNIGWCCGYRHDHSIVAEGGDNTPERGTPTAYCYLASDPENVPLYCETNDWPYSSSPTELGNSVAQNSRYSVTKTYCYNNEQTLFVECASEDILPYTTDSFDGMYNLTSNSYCEGYRDGDSTRRYYIPNSPDWCTYKGVTNTDYIAKITNDEVACIPTVTSQQTCTNNDDVSLTYCKVVSESSFTQCPDEYTVTSQSDCGAGGDQPRTACYVDCGEVYCLGYACTEAYQACQDLFNEKVAEGYKLTDISDSSLDDYTACDNGGTLKYLKFGCKDFVATNLSEGETCATLGAENASSCTYYEELTSDTTTTQYQCKCPDSYKTEAECAAELANGDTAKIVAGGLECRLPLTASPTRAADDPEEPQVQQAPTEYQYCRLKSEMCSNGDTRGVHYIDGVSYIYSYVSSSSEYPISTADCYKNEHELANKVSVTLYCAGFEDHQTRQAAICTQVNGNDDIELGSCHYYGDSANTPYYGGGEPKVDYYYCDCPDDYKTKEDWCKESYSEGTPEYQECIDNTTLSGTLCYTHPTPEATADNPVQYSQGKVLGSGLTCSPEYKTKEEWCSDPNNESKLISGYNCNQHFVGLGNPCIVGEESKYVDYGLNCDAAPAMNVKEYVEGCQIEGDSNSLPVANLCYYKETGDLIYNFSKFKHVCRCPDSYTNECAETYQTPGGPKCEYDRNNSGTTITKYANCNITCGTDFAINSASTINGCDYIDGYATSVRGGMDEPQMCTEMYERKEQFICSCPKNFVTIEDWCALHYEDEGISENDCKVNYTGQGTSCTWDIVVNETTGAPIKNLTKYASYVRFCPADRPLYYSESDCSYVGGEYDYSCKDSKGTERVTCRCPISYYAQYDTNNSCNTQDISSYTFLAEPSGTACDLDGASDIKYAQCIAKCTSILDEVAISGAYTYLSADNQTPTQIMCSNTLGNGAVLGLANQAYCSLNNTLMYPCYCPDNFEECPASENLMPVPNALVCKVNGKTYYSGCTEAACALPSSDTVILDPNTFPDTGSISAIFGPKVTIKKCTNDAGQPAWEVKCDSKVYTDPCDYPYEPDPSNGDYCLVGENGANLNASSRPHYKSGQCKVQKNFGVCGEEIVGSADGDYTIAAVTQTESECTSKFGPGAKSQLCEYGKEQGYKRAYNCYYNPKEFIYTTANCGVRHDLTGNYIILNGKKYWSECNCTSAYQHHKFNCGGMLSGNPCQQYITQDFINEFDLSGEGYSVGEQIPFYPYCECSADYTEICDEDGSGRYKGVGTACNGKYTACECVPDKLPDNWTDNYYGCPGGKKPTGVWKDNGCGQKYYQCEVVECTWEYTEMCEAPLIPVGQSCQDNEGNIGGYKACTCPSDYKVCAAGQVGEGEPCNLKGVSYYKSCTSQDGCTSLASETCTGPLQIGVNPCTRDDITYFESCVCANGYDKVCGEGEVGVGNYCELDGVKYYKDCVNPKDNECTDGHVTACDTNQESYSPCTAKDELTGKEVVKYMCRCPTNWKACGSGSGEQCTSKDASGKETIYYEECNSGAPTCSPYQELTYKVCTPAQTGDGGSCTSSTSSTDATGTEITVDVIKYAVCKDSGNCLTNGFRFSCTGYDQSALGESCVDDQGNKLYKECPCPKSYVECSNGNATKGKKCVPLLQSGSYGPTVYSSCECDRSKYKYTCEAEDNNKGIVAPKSSNYCEIEEEVEVDVNEIIENEDGTTSTTTKKETQTKKVKYYSSCECKEEYAYTCGNSANGEVVPAGYNEDYCLINGTKFYKGCDCNNKYTVMADDCKSSEGKVVDLQSGTCSVRGTVSTTTYDEEGNSSTVTKPAGTYYGQCRCKTEYNQSCDDIGYDQSSLIACDGLYNQCICDKTIYSKSCTPYGLNQGVKGALNPDDICVNKVVDSTGNSKDTYSYEACSCENSYSLECSADDGYDQTGVEYCDKGDGSTLTYERCVCSSTLFDKSYLNNPKGAALKTAMSDGDLTSADIDAYCGLGNSNYALSSPTMCREKSSNGTETDYPNYNLCNDILEGYNKLSDTTYTDNNDFLSKARNDTPIKNKIKSLCGHTNNAHIYVASDRKAYYKCIVDEVASSGSEWFTEEECTSLSNQYEVSGDSHVLAGSWLDDVTIYSGCDCASNFNRDVACTEREQISQLQNSLAYGVTLEAPLCFNFGWINNSSGPWWIGGSSKSCGNSIDTTGSSCRQRGKNTYKYDWSKCKCRTSGGYQGQSDGTLDKCNLYQGYTGYSQCSHTICMDRFGHIANTFPPNSVTGSGGYLKGSKYVCSFSGETVSCQLQ